MNARNIFSISFFVGLALIFGMVFAGCGSAGWDAEASGNKVNSENNPDNNTQSGNGNTIIQGDGNTINVNNPNTSVTYTINFNINGGSGNTPDPLKGASGSTTYLPSGDELSKNGFTFGGWNTKADGTGTNYNAGPSYTIPSANITLYAKWNTNNTDSSNNGRVPSTGGDGYSPVGPENNGGERGGQGTSDTVGAGDAFIPGLS
jgi:uncharacterized repeat protein (TIGR02543 family)